MCPEFGIVMPLLFPLLVLVLQLVAQSTTAAILSDGTVAGSFNEDSEDTDCILKKSGNTRIQTRS